MLNDLHFAIRMLAKSPVFSAIVVLILALGIGANVAIFTLINGVFLRPPARVGDPDQLVAICELELQSGRPDMDLSYPDYVYYRDSNTVFSGLASHGWTYLVDGHDARELNANVVSGSYFSVLEVKPHLGRFFLPEEDQAPDRDAVVVLSYEFWQRRFDGDVATIGRSIQLNGITFTVVGVAPRGFRGALVGNSADVWIPNMMSGDGDFFTRESSWIDLIGRLKPGRTLGEARAEMAVLARHLEEAYPETKKGAGVYLSALRGVHPTLRAEKGELSALLTAVVTCLLLIACANVAGLLLVRSVARRKEIAVRLALGASRGRLVRQFLSESLLLSLSGGGIGLIVAFWMVELLNRYFSPEMEGVTPVFDLSFDSSVVLFTLLLAALTGLIFGLPPAVQASRPDLVPALKEDAAAFAYRRSRLRAALIVTQVALTLILLVGAGLLSQSLRKLTLNPGFHPEQVAFIRMKPHLSGYDRTKSGAYFREVRRRLEGLPGVESVTFAGYPPLPDWGDRVRVFSAGSEPARPADAVQARHNGIAPDFFETLKIPLLKGRIFDAGDMTGKLPVVIINQALAQRLWPDGDPLDRALMVDGKQHVVVGVVQYENYRRSGEAPKPFLFRPGGGNRMLVRLKGDPRVLIPSLRREITAVDPNVAISEELPLTDVIQSSFIRVKLAAGVLGYVGSLALLLSGIGLYGLLAFVVSQRTREIGIRVALGATSTDVWKLVVSEGLKLALSGLAIGLVGAFVLARLMSSYLYGVSQSDPFTFASISCLLAGVSVLACYLPARRAARVDPMVALRCE